MAHDGVVTVVVTAPVSLAQCTPAQGQASVQFINATNGGAIGTAVNAFTVTDPGQIECVLPLPRIVKSPDAGTILVGEKATFTSVVGNGAASPVAWKNVTVTDQLPSPLSGGSWVVITQPSTGTCGSPVPVSNLLTCTAIGDLNPGDSRTIVVQTLNVVATADAGASFLNETAVADAPACTSNGVDANGGPGAYGQGSNSGPVCDPGDITVASVCDLEIDKVCEVAAPAYVCAKPITSMSMQWKGAVCVRIAGFAGTSPSTPFDIDNVCPDDVVTVSGYNGNQGNDVLWNIYAAGSTGTKGFLGQSSFHLSCSDVNMNSADDCGKINGDNKGLTACNPGSFNVPAGCYVNEWILAGMGGPTPAQNLVCPGFGSNGGTVDCTVAPAQYECTKPMTALTMQWNGGKQIASISAVVSSTPPVTVLYAPVGGITPGDTVTIAGYNGSLGNDVFWDITFADATTGQSVFHLSCSDDDMDSADDCNKPEGGAKGSVACSPAPCVNDWTLKGIAGPLGSPASASLTCGPSGPIAASPVTYHRTVTNNSATTANNVKVQDIVTDSGGQHPPIDIICPATTLAGGASMTCTDVDQVGETTTDVGTVTAEGCPVPAATSNTVTVTVGGGGGGGGGACPTAAATLTAKDTEAKWKITAPAGNPVEISKIEIAFPQATNGTLNEIKLDAPSMFKGSLTSPATVTTVMGSVKDRRIDKGKSDDLKFKFANKPVASTGYDITVTFTNSCTLHIVQ